MARQPFVQERVIGVEEVKDAAILAKNAADKKFCLALHGLAEVIVEIGKGAGIRRDGAQVTQEEPLIGETGHKRLRARIGEHALYLPFEFGGCAEIGSQKFVIGNARPQKKREPRGQFNIADAINRTRGKARGLGLDAEKKLRIGKNQTQGTLDAGFEIPLVAAWR